MQKQFVRAFGQIQELFQQLNDAGHVNQEQAELFDKNQKIVVNYHSWVKQQLEGGIKVELPWTEPEFEEAWKLWRDFKKQQFNFTYKPIGEQGALKDLADLSDGNMRTAIAIIHQSIKKGWRGLFSLRENKALKQQVTETRNVDYKQQLLTRLGGQNEQH